MIPLGTVNCPFQYFHALIAVTQCFHPLFMPINGFSHSTSARSLTFLSVTRANLHIKNLQVFYKLALPGMDRAWVEEWPNVTETDKQRISDNLLHWRL